VNGLGEIVGHRVRIERDSKIRLIQMAPSRVDRGGQNVRIADAGLGTVVCLNPGQAAFDIRAVGNDAMNHLKGPLQRRDQFIAIHQFRLEGVCSVGGSFQVGVESERFGSEIHGRNGKRAGLPDNRVARLFGCRQHQGGPQLQTVHRFEGNRVKLRNPRDQWQGRVGHLVVDTQCERPGQFRFLVPRSAVE
jgi:hypothetical protein